MNISRLLIWAGIFAAILPIGRAAAGPSWVEDNDAGEVPGTSAKTGGSGSISSIFGTLDPAANVAGIPDFVDMYLIFIPDPTAFSAQTLTSPGLPGSAQFDSQLWLFDEHGRGVLGNDNGLPEQTGSRLTSAATDQTGQVIPKPGFYYLAISAFDTDPLSTQGEPLFNQENRTEISGPDGPAGLERVAAWGTSSQGGTYVIAVTGAEFAPEIPATSTWGLTALFCATAIAGSLCLRRKNVGIHQS